MLVAWISGVVRAALPAGTRRWLRSSQKSLNRLKPFGKDRAGLLNQVEPVSRVFGLDRGTPIDRFYIERFLWQHRADIRGHVLEIESDIYSQMFGEGRVRHCDVLHVSAGNPHATIVADLASADAIASDTFDCIILTQTLQFIFDASSAIRHVHRILKPGGVVLATVPGISQISQYDRKQWGDYWRFTSTSVSRLFGTTFSEQNISVDAYGNALAASAFLHGLAAEELQQDELASRDSDYEVLIAVRGVRR
jgi:SAM-dependent methyltransferase